MISKILSMVVLSFTIAVINPLHAEPQNLAFLKNDIKIYHDSGRYEAELSKTILQAKDYLLKQVSLYKQNPDHKKLAIVLDIDETSLSNYNKMVERNFVSNAKQLHKDFLEASAPAITPMLSLYKAALKHHVAVFFVTGRSFIEREATQKNLLQAGYAHWNGLYLRPEDYDLPTIVPFKSQTRCDIEKQGYEIIETIGDQDSDLKGGCAKKGFKLPNPFYYIS